MIRVPAVIFCTAMLAGCGLTPSGADLDMTTTGSIAPAAAPEKPSMPPTQPNVVEAVAPSDWERIRLVASTSLVGLPNGGVIDWTNPDTGSNGTISPLLAARNEPDGRNCRAFALTVSDIRGIRRYRGDACRATDGMWQLFDVTPEDSALL
ncbi:RT0821/Lpp0805 family surface protein [Kaistia dalseonensis]|uniref:Surface antigen n=1 Tax=Kaistia dalseonensis TaxID=410840 RepID=A0ABU0HCN5_9HYPH|nr:RT0821/Lpp0805 family surface protein [Kaistia dalseonensis]MCX5497432.1 RT0821/Lpp0805 family surface protein [Kaistia dalseonensis]MDQ0440071.1 surface antigen [Kaistia dalseonensis]